MENTCIIGYGVVGQATAKIFGIDKYFDLNPERSNISLEDAGKCKFIFICLPTEVKEDGSYDVEALIDTIAEIENYGSPVYIIRSTVYPGFADRVKKLLNLDRIISNPEFLNEATAELDAKNPPFVLLGGEADFVEQVAGYYRVKVKGAPIITTDNITAEMAKLTMNGYFATKVIFANQAYDACRELGANYETVKKILEAHPNGPKNHFTVWYKGKRGVNGRCLPKDSKAFAHYAKSELVQKVVELNEKYISLKEDNGK